MKTSVLITGVSGSGKTTICKTLSNLGYNAIDIEDIQNLYELVDEKTGEIVAGSREDIQDGLDWNCNKQKLKQLVDKESAVLTFYCGGMANTEDIWNIFDSVIFLTVTDTTTLQRLSSRAFGEFGNTKKDRTWVLSWKHNIEKKWLSAGGLAINAEPQPSEIANNIVHLAKNRIYS